MPRISVINSAVPDAIVAGNTSVRPVFSCSSALTLQSISTINCFDIANFFLAQQDENAGDTISNLKLQKLLYYAQGYHLGMFSSPLFPERIEAWTHGPVVSAVYHKYKTFSGGAILPTEEISLKQFTRSQVDFLNEIYNVFGQYSAWKLRDMTHNEDPWKETPLNCEISRSVMQNYFKQFITRDEEQV